MAVPVSGVAVQFLAMDLMALEVQELKQVLQPENLVLLSFIIEINMQNFAIIENGKVINVVVADLDYATEQGWVSLPENAGIGWDYINGQFVDNRPVTVVEPLPAPTKEQLLEQLLALQSQIEALS